MAPRRRRFRSAKAGRFKCCSFICRYGLFLRLLTVLWNSFCAGFAEEIFSRGYIQSRVDQNFGRPRRLLGVEFGLGLLVSSTLFGFIHVLNPVDYFSGRLDFAWLWFFPNLASGLFFGVLRAKTGSVWVGGIVHGLTDALGTVPALLP